MTGVLKGTEGDAGSAQTEDRPHEDTVRRNSPKREPKREASEGTSQDDMVVWSWTSSHQKCKDTFLLCHPSSLWYFVISALAE